MQTKSKLGLIFELQWDQEESDINAGIAVDPIYQKACGPGVSAVSSFGAARIQITLQCSGLSDSFHPCAAGKITHLQVPFTVRSNLTRTPVKLG